MDDLWKDNNNLYKVLCFFITENEKLFDRSDARLYWKTVFHTFSIILHVYITAVASCFELENNPDVEIQSLHTYRAGYITGWNFAFQTIFLTLSLVHDILEWLNKHEYSLASRLRYWRDVIFSGLVVPFTLFVSSMFWCVYAVDRELVFPKAYDDVVPWWFNHCVHTNISVVVLIETLLQARRRPRDFKREITFVIVIDILYAIVYYSIYFFTHRWLYRVFGVMTWWQVCLYQLLIWLSSFVFYFIQFPINRLIHGGDDESEKVSTGIIQPATDIVTTVNTQVGEDETTMNGVKDDENNDVNGVNKGNTDLKIPPFSTKSWSLKYRSIRSQFENSHL
ncbi:unnamed protein product [Parnassius mnemosyne]|uniref:Androgen-dependent TFPI-regulating protein n=1 Tax=Parnassius mnemosyne TaxID=213953 RepID=A0AAV1LH46_9NEOP